MNFFFLLQSFLFSIQLSVDWCNNPNNVWLIASSFSFFSFFLQGRSKSLTHIDTLDSGMLVQREEGDCRSEPDTTPAMATAAANMTTTAASAAATQLIVPVPVPIATVAASPSSPVNSSPPITTTTANPIVTTPNDQAQRRRRLSTLFQVRNKNHCQ